MKLAIVPNLLTIVTGLPGKETTTMAKFEVAIYNAEVRQKVADGERHRRFTDEWADMHYIEIEADNEEQARALVEVMHPSVQGFVIDEFLEIGGGSE